MFDLELQYSLLCLSLIKYSLLCLSPWSIFQLQRAGIMIMMLTGA